ncbi:MAG: class I SAM-dependent methyltransferase [Pseudomonadales bacterium]
MATHQQIANLSDEELVKRMVASHGSRFDENFWSFFKEFVDPHIDAEAQFVDIGCGPGLFLRDLGQRYPIAKLFGSDVTQAMLDYAAKVEYTGSRPEYALHDITEESLPFADGAVNLLSMVAVLHVLNDPFAVCEEIKRVLNDDGIFLLQDWIRSPLPDYLERMTSDVEEEKKTTARNRLIPLFSVHNRYTIDDWMWLLNAAGFMVNEYRQLSSAHFRTFVCQKKLT